MSSVELLTVVVGLLVGYGIIAGLMSARASNRSSSNAPQEDGTRADRQGQPRGGPSESPSPEWIRANWHEVLGVSPNASSEVIKSAYRLRAHQYHPDRTEGLGPELKVLAEQRMQELNAAYAWATSRRGR